MFCSWRYQNPTKGDKERVRVVVAVSVQVWNFSIFKTRPIIKNSDFDSPFLFCSHSPIFVRSLPSTLGFSLSSDFEIERWRRRMRRRRIRRSLMQQGWRGTGMVKSRSMRMTWVSQMVALVSCWAWMVEPPPLSAFACPWFPFLTLSSNLSLSLQGLLLDAPITIVLGFSMFSGFGHFEWFCLH